LRVLIATPHVFAGGAEKAALNLAYHLNSMGCDVSIATLSLDLSRLPQYLHGLNYILPVKPLDPPSLDGTMSVLGCMLRELYALVALIKDCDDGFEVINPCNLPSYWAAVLSMPRTPIVWTSSEVLGPVNQTRDLYERSGSFRFALKVAAELDRYLVRWGIDAIVTCSELNRRLIMERYGRDAAVIPTGVDYEFFSQDVPDAKQRLGLEDSYLLLHVGSLVKRKNQLVSIRALKILKKLMDDIKLILVGTGPWEEILKDKVRRLGLGEDVLFMGSVTEEELRLLYHASDINLFPVKDQTWGLVPFEALATGKPSIVSEECGSARVMGKERIGLMINPRAEDLAEAVIFALKHPEYMEDIVKRGQRYVQENLTWEKYAREMYGVFRDMFGVKYADFRIR